MRHPFTRHGLTLAVALASGLMTQNLAAQALEEVIVTAQKRSESLQDTPISISAFNSEAIESMGLNNVKDIGLATPSLQTPAYPTSSNNLAYFIRGIGNTDSIILTKDNTVGVYYDGVYAGRNTGVLADLSDLERIEILRGPQGTLYGRNTTAGAISFVTKKPSGEFALDQTFTAGNYGYKRSVTSVDLPTVVGVKSSVSVALSERDGWVKNGGAGKIAGGEYNDFYLEDKKGLRIALRYDQVDDLIIDYSFDYSDMDTTAPYFQYAGDTGAGLNIAGGDISASYGDRLEKTFDANTGQRRAYNLPITTTKTRGQSLTVQYDINDFLSFKSITGYRAFDDNLSQNFANAFGGASGLEIHTITEHEQYTQEFQLSGMTERWKYVGGLYYLKEEGSAAEQQFLDRALVDTTGLIAFDSNGPCVSGAFGAAPPVCNVLDPMFYPAYLGEFTVDSEVESYAIYGQATWTPDILDDRLDVTFGARYTEDDRSASRTTDALLWGTLNPGSNSSSLDQDDWKLNLNYSWTDSVSTYATVATAFRSGGSSPKALDFSETFDQETLVSYELGVKSELLDNRVRLNAAVFQTNIDDVILDYLPDPVRAPNIVSIFNSGEAEIRGLEIDLLAAISANFQVSVNYAYLDSKIKDAIFPDGSDRTKTTVLAWSPEHAYSVAVDYNLPLNDLGELKAHLDYSWQDDQYALSNTNEGEVLVDDFGTLNARISLDYVQMLGGEWQVALWAKNLTDEDSANYRIGMTAFTFMQPRTYGLDLRFRY
ncbi:TonB-dependent receptor [Parahaliea sp. F7430]|uniref:TonB-dependent receptor n=1 Tax=Sediminihaliea albiluteola TaxID=2758564 RepID=A0A7W2TYD4_9GAMM|nr:TonB-dependent receptor [Sediminihaliea albiluteola]MBA6414248.1 TonB-dependent receptor [Sediminihaliea albiluteola]